MGCALLEGFVGTWLCCILEDLPWEVSYDVRLSIPDGPEYVLLARVSCLGGGLADMCPPFGKSSILILYFPLPPFLMFNAIVVGTEKDESGDVMARISNNKTRMRWVTATASMSERYWYLCWTMEKKWSLNKLPKLCVQREVSELYDNNST